MFNHFKASDGFTAFCSDDYFSGSASVWPNFLSTIQQINTYEHDINFCYMTWYLINNHTYTIN